MPRTTLRFPRPKGAKALSLSPARGSSSRNIPVQAGSFKSFDGTRISYCIEGEGPALVFCYGLVCSSLHWTYQIDHFRQTHQCIWMDYRAHQNSEVPKNLETLNARDFAADLKLLTETLNLDQAVFLGHSMGVNVILELYKQSPSAIRAMVLSNGTPRRPLETMLHGNAPQAGLRTLRRIHNHAPWLVRKFWNLQKGNPLSQLVIRLGGFNPFLSAPEDIQTYVDQVAELGPEIFLTLIENYEKCDETAWLHEIQIPVLLLAGEKDHMTPPAIQQLMHQLIPRSELRIIPRGSHCPQMDLPEMFNQRIEDFLKRIKY